ncbi:Mitogen-activated protein kinase kinase kinase 1 [Glycine soja]|nr:Mitogen-activated protein kinase kinase kinase 1 [Glycine max]
MQENLKKLKEVNRNLRKEIRQRMGDCMNDLGLEDLKLLEEEMDKAAKVVRECKATKFNDVKSSKGSPYWMALEVSNLKNQGGYGLAVDIWSLGCTVLEMLTRQPPYSELEGVLPPIAQKHVIQLILSHERNFRADELMEFYKVIAFSEYCENKFVIEPVEVIFSDGNSNIYPDLSVYNMEVSLSYITGLIGVSLEAEEVIILLLHMSGVILHLQIDY